jgi:DNA-binding transcriptional LysR family regulator
VRIAALPSYAAGPLPDAISRFSRTHKQVRFVVKDAVSSRVLDMVRSEAVDIGIAGSPVRDADLEIVHTFQDRMCVVFPTGHPIGRRRAIGLKDLGAYPIILMDPDTSVRAVVDAAFLSSSTMPLVACEATYMMTAVAMVRAGLGITILPESAREIRIERGVASRAIGDPRFRRPITVIKKRNRTLPPAAQAFLQAVVAAMRGG